MRDTGYDAQAPIIERRASGYYFRGANDLQNASYIDMSGAFAAGGLYSTTRDLAIWENALFGGTVLSPNSLKKMIAPYKSGYALGLRIRTVRGHRSIWHNGAIVGFNAAMAYYPDERISVIVLSNVDGLAPAELESNIAQVALRERVVLPSERKAIALAPRVLDRYVGRYSLENDVFIEVKRDRNRLFAQVTGQGPAEIFPEAERKFFAKVVDAQFRFEVDAVTGHSMSVVLHQAGRDIPAPRVSDSSSNR